MINLLVHCHQIQSYLVCLTGSLAWPGPGYRLAHSTMLISANVSIISAPNIMLVINYAMLIRDKSSHFVFYYNLFELLLGKAEKDNLIMGRRNPHCAHTIINNLFLCSYLPLSLKLGAFYQLSN